MCVLFVWWIIWVVTASGEDFMSIASLQRYFLGKMVTCSILILPAVCWKCADLDFYGDWLGEHFRGRTVSSWSGKHCNSAKLSGSQWGDVCLVFTHIDFYSMLWFFYVILMMQMLQKWFHKYFSFICNQVWWWNIMAGFKTNSLESLLFFPCQAGWVSEFLCSDEQVLLNDKHMNCYVWMWGYNKLKPFKGRSE